MSGPEKQVQAAVVQMTSGADLNANLIKSKRFAAEAASQGATFILFPECFCFLGEREADKFAVAEVLDAKNPGPILGSMIEMATKHKAWICGAGIPETIGDSAYNTLAVVNPKGELVQTYRKIHLFDVDLPGTRLCESDATVRGDAIKSFKSDFGEVGLSICYDLRFPELFRKLVVDQQVQTLLCPAAFTAKTGPAHWHVLLRARAIENQCFMLAAGQTGRHNPKRASYGHSLIIDPWGTVLAEIKDDEGVAVAELDFSMLENCRKNMPCLSHRVLT